ncbi:hypothetical protein MPSEU_000799900 [Mayamaea pseudoterrestris]|nr:hypothetical protein MPSEU_000799900 [Mayamaea pseudoterrestris]
MASFAKWYFHKLKHAPLTTNMTSAMMVMIIGDALAQGMEKKFMEDIQKVDEQPSRVSMPYKSAMIDIKRETSTLAGPEAKVAFRRYGTLSPDVQEVHRDLVRRKDAESAEATDNFTHWKETLESSITTLRLKFNAIDYFRMGTMTFWAAAVVTPYFISVYNLMDQHFPHGRTTTAVGLRVMGSFVASVPLNAAFFCYGTFIYHLGDWWSLVFGSINERPSASTLNGMKEYPFNMQLLASSVLTKLNSELLTTLQASASVWMPINTFSFYFAAPHIRPLVLMVFSAFWNCYLSLAQHRDAEL